MAIYGTVHEKIAPLIYYKNVIKIHHVCIAITSQRLTLSTSYFHHFILHHFSTVKCILESWTISVPTFLRAIPLGFKTTISSCKSNQIASNSVCRWRGPISIYLFCSLIFMPSVTEIQLNKLRAHFRARFAPMIWANCAPLNVWGGGDYYIGANQAGKRARSLFNCISVTDGIKINEQNKSIGIGPLYLHTEFEAI